ncbi:MAG: hypothetical protein CL868_12085 [Cytophagaceae bacterium]|nr:hypothetical protein [Cytophagaceae bacterium]
MKKTLYIFLLLAGMFFSCKREKPVQEDPTKATDTLEIDFKRPIAKVQLFQKGMSATANWTGYKEISLELETLGKMKIDYIKQEGEQWIEQIKKMKVNIPDSLNTPAIKSRLTVLETKTEMLFQETKKTVVDTSLVFNEATELNEAFQDLKARINITFQKSVEELLEEYRKAANDTTMVIPGEENTSVQNKQKTNRKPGLPLLSTPVKKRDSIKKQ